MRFFFTNSCKGKMRYLPQSVRTCAGDRIRTGDLVRDRDPGTARLPYARITRHGHGALHDSIRFVLINQSFRRARNSFSPSTGTPSFFALSSLEPGSAPATT